MLLYIDVESVGLMGQIKLIQFATDNSPVYMIELHRGWEAHEDTRIKLKQLFVQYIDNPDTCFVAFNAAFDLFNEMKLEGLRPDLVAYNALIAAGMNGNKPDEVSGLVITNACIIPSFHDDNHSLEFLFVFP